MIAGQAPASQPAKATESPSIAASVSASLIRAWAQTTCGGTRDVDAPSATNAPGARRSSNEHGVGQRPASSSQSTVHGAQEVVTMTVKSRRGLGVGGFIALVVPISYLVLALLVEKGIAPYDQTHSLLDLIGLLGWISLFLLGPVGIVIAGRSAGVRGAGAWLGLTIVAVPVFAFVWFVCVATLSGALGNPF
jgi:hypothetical protein